MVAPSFQAQNGSIASSSEDFWPDQVRARRQITAQITFLMDHTTTREAMRRTALEPAASFEPHSGDRHPQGMFKAFGSILGFRSVQNHQEPWVCG